ncbi:hypothetical protein FOA52_002028 [Chlamydomonas sp. UWO 241]|nr:hypothetical protein FOA52_002028 [Chlamydomonas sp. UWO 241]
MQMSQSRVFFNYEKRIRDKSSLDKVFDYFSSSKDEHGIKTMLPQDLLQAIVPTFPPSKSDTIRAGYLDGERTQPAAPSANSSEFFSNFDIDGDGVLAFNEFLLVLTLISIPKMDVHIIFDIMDADSSGYVDAREFDVIVKRLQDKANLQVNKYALGRQNRLLSDHVGGLMAAFFGLDLSQKLSLAQFALFLDNLHLKLIKLEFEHYMPNDDGCIPGIDFARALVTAADMMAVDELLNKVDSLEGLLSHLDISFPEFESIHHLVERIDPLVVALEFMDQVGRPVTKEELVKQAQRLTGVLLSDHVARVIISVFGNADGHLNVPLFLGTLRRRGQMAAIRRGGSDQLPRSRVQRLFSCMQACNADAVAPA